MFRQEIRNASTLHKGFNICIPYMCRRKLPDPEKINPFVASLIDPFKEKEEYDDMHTWGQDYESRRVNLKQKPENNIPGLCKCFP